MANVKKKRLFKIASEINIGKDAIVTYLKQKGFEVENKPTTMLTEDMVTLVYDKFKREMRAIEVQREKIEKVKGTRKPDDENEYQSEHEHESGHEVALQDYEVALQEQQETQQKKVQTPTVSEKEEVLMPQDIVEAKVIKPLAKPEAAGVGDIIDLSAIKNDTASRRKKAPKNANDAKVSATKTTNESTARKPNAKANEVDKKEPRGKENEPKTEKKAQPRKAPAKKPVAKPVAKTTGLKTDSPKGASPKSERTEKTTPRRATTKPAAKPAAKRPESPTAIKNREQRNAMAEEVVANQVALQKKQEEEKRLATAPQLKGLTVLGKIDIRPPAPKVEPVEEKTERRKRRRRKPADDAATASTAPVRTGPRKSLRTGASATGAYATGTSATGTSENREARPPRAKVGTTAERVRKKIESITTETAEKEAKKHFTRKGQTIDIEDKKNTPNAANDDRANKKRRRKRKGKLDPVSKIDVEKTVRMTMLEMDSSSSTTSRQKMRSKRKAEKDEKIQKELELQLQDEKILKLTEFVTTSDLANLMHVGLNEVILKCMELGLMVTINQRLDKDTILLIADDFGFDVEFVDEKQMQFVDEEIDDETNLKHRSPIVTIMGHVDHGKTSLLDYVRNANVVAGEAGGITQHIGAYTVAMPDGKSITFLDTPGHEAFTAMRARGAQVTDIVVLIVAADDSVMPQTIEAISHSKAANVPIIVAINKCDKPDANIDRIKQQLTDYDVLVEDWGGKYQCVPISAKKGTNIDQLLDKILIEAEMLELKANPDRMARGIVIESNMSKGFGPVATVMVRKGTLKVGDAFVSGTRYGRVRALLDDKGTKVESVGPSTPVVVIGYDGLAEAGDSFMAMSSESDGRKIASERGQLKREQELRQVHHVTLDEISQQIQLGGVEDLNLLIKADVGGSAEALADALLKLSTPEVRVNILHKGIGAITETDVMLAAASRGIVIGFNINPNASARRIAEREHVDIRRYDIIYDCINEVQLALEGLLAPEIRENITAVVEVRQTFKISKIGTIAGCHVLSGTIKRNSKIRLLRDGFKIYEGTISSLKREKDDAAKVDKGYECGLQIDGYNDLKPDDLIEAYELEEIKRTLH